MPQLKIYGASDDLVEFEGAFNEEYNTDMGEFLITSPDGQSLVVDVMFGTRIAHASDWVISVRTTGTFPSWQLNFGEREDEGIDPALFIEVPEGTTVEQINVSEDDNW